MPEFICSRRDSSSGQRSFPLVVDPLPSVILGHANGKIKGGQHLKYPQDSRHADLLYTLLQRNEIPVESIGDSGAGLSEV